MISRVEFAAIMAYMGAAVGKEPTEEQAEVYFDLLGDLPKQVLEAAAKRSICEHTFPTMPPIGLIRKHADALRTGQRMSYGEAWELSCRAARDFGYRNPRDGLASLPPVVAHAVKAFGWSRLCDCPTSGDGLNAAVAQFRDIFNGLNQREDFERMLPASTQAPAVAAIADRFAMPAIEGGHESR